MEMEHLEKMRDAIYKNQIGRAFTEMLKADTAVARQYFNDSFSVTIHSVRTRCEEPRALWWFEAFAVHVNGRHAGWGTTRVNDAWPDSYQISFSSEKKWLVSALCWWFSGSSAIGAVIIPYTNYQGVMSLGSYFTALWDLTLVTDKAGNTSYETEAR